MKIMKAIEKADALCPNPYTLEEKLDWCDEVTAEIRRNILKEYDVIETNVNSRGELDLPDDIPFDRIEVVYIGNQTLSKQDFRSFVQNHDECSVSFGIPKRLKLVCLRIPPKIRNIDIRGEFNTGENYIEMEMPEFKEGDKIEIAELDNASDTVDWSTVISAYVIESSLDKIILDRDALTAQTAAKLAIRRVIDDETAAADAPYDSMYTEYILAKMALYQHDYVGYDAHMTQYNCLFESMRRELKTRCPMNEQVRFKNYSIC